MQEMTDFKSNVTNSEEIKEEEITVRTNRFGRILNVCVDVMRKEWENSSDLNMRDGLKRQIDALEENGIMAFSILMSIIL